jgi:hypothetical protein
MLQIDIVASSVFKVLDENIKIVLKCNEQIKHTKLSYVDFYITRYY